MAYAALDIAAAGFAEMEADMKSRKGTFDPPTVSITKGKKSLLQLDQERMRLLFSIADAVGPRRMRGAGRLRFHTRTITCG
jgi:hypothetical protein